jgi:hypothetical protein
METLNIKPRYIKNAQGKRTGVLLSIKQWEDLQDVLLSRSRENEPRVSWEMLKKQLTDNDDLSH